MLVGYEDNGDAGHTGRCSSWSRNSAAGVPAARGAGRCARREPLWQALVEFAGAGRGSADVQGEPAAAAAWREFCLQAEALAEPAALQAHAGNGIVRGHCAGDLTERAPAAMLCTLARAGREAGGSVVVTQLPGGVEDALPVWGPPRGDAWLMREVKSKLDPQRLFNPGRFVDGSELPDHGDRTDAAPVAACPNFPADALPAASLGRTSTTSCSWTASTAACALGSCPTYVETGDENDSPRGRIYLMRAVTDGRLELDDEVRSHLDLCLDAGPASRPVPRACSTAS